MTVKDTICAIATGMGNSGIGIVRVSGSEAIEITDRIFRGKKQLRNMPSYTAAYGNIVEPHSRFSDGSMGERILDEVIVLVMRSPHTYTTEDTVEIDCHGGVVILKKVMELLIQNGARTAEPGEFTKRAYLGGRIDMSQAEAVMDLIHAKNEMALNSSMHQLKGELRQEITAMREKILYHTAYIESALDDPENYSLESYPQILEDDVDNLLKNVSRLLKTCENGRLIQEGIRTAIIGRPNAGKSSVLNMMLGEERAIVTDIEGTTRDTLEETVNINGILLKLIDTAGIRNTVDIVEKIGVDKARENIQSADLVLYIVDGSQDLNENDESIIQELTGKKVITLLNKSDLETRINRQQLEELLLAGIYGWSQGQEKQPLHILDISAREGTGKDALYDMLSEMFFGGDISYNDEMYITNARHKEALFAARDSLLQVKESIAMGVGEDFYTIDLLAAYESLGLIIGEALEDDLADKIFREFCMGK